MAALFAIECRNQGHTVMLAARRDLFEGLIGPSNDFAMIESAVNLRIPPIEFREKAEFVVDVDDALQALRAIGIEQIPVRIRDKEMLRETLMSSYDDGQRLNEEQIQLVNSLVFGAQS